MFWRGQTAPAVVATDDVFNLTLCDDNMVMRQISFLACFYFDEVLDPSKICDAMEILLSSSREWRYLGGRLRLHNKVNVD